MGASDVRKRTKLDQDFGSGTPATWYWGLSTTEPNADGSGVTEPVGNNYSRVAMANNPTNFPPAVTTGGRTLQRNGVNVTWPNPSGPWGVVGWYVLFLAASGGTYQYANKLDSSIAPKAGNTPVQLDANAAEFTVA